MVTVHTLDRLPCDGPRKCDGSRNSDDPTRRVVYHNSRQLIHVVRFEYAGEVLPAKVAENTPTTSHSINSGGNTVSHNTWEYLSIRPNCSAAWMEYSLPLSDPLPAGSIIGGHFSDGTPLYVARIWVESYGRTVPGYFNPATQIATAECYGTQTSQTVEILTIW